MYNTKAYSATSATSPLASTKIPRLVHARSLYGVRSLLLLFCCLGAIPGTVYSN
jgi:hypothetical protein